MSTRRSIGTRLRGGSRAVILCLALAIGGWLIGFGSMFGLDGQLLALGLESQTIRQLSSSVAFNVVGAAGIGLTYLIIRRNGFDLAFCLEFLRIRKPTVWDLCWIVFGLGGAFMVLGGYLTIVELIDPFGTGSESETHSGIEEGRQYPALFLVGIPIALFLTGPGEELLYRGVIQSRLGESFPTAIAVALASVVFAVVHFPVYMGDDLGTVLVSIGTVLALGAYLGVLYELSDSLLVPALVHGAYNATVYLTNYLTYA